MPLVSIVIPAYQAARFLPRALESVRAQTHAEWELIVVEDGSNDGTALIVSEFAAKGLQPVRYENNGTNLGVSASRNLGMELALGEVIAFLDADDWWMPEHLASGLRTLDAGSDFCCSGFHLYDERSQKETSIVIPDAALFQDPLLNLYSGNFIQTSSLVMLRREAARKCGGFDGALKVGEDCDYWMRLLANGFRLSCTGEATCYYVKHAASAMSKSLMVAEHSVLFCRKQLANEKLPPAVRKAGYARSLWIYGRMIQRENPRQACRQFVEAWRVHPQGLNYLLYAVRAGLFSLLPRR